jgi:hypothetical protein
VHHGTPLLPLLAIAGKSFKSTQTPQPAQSSNINNIQHTIALVTKEKLDCIWNQNNPLPEERIAYATLLLSY